MVNESFQNTSKIFFSICFFSPKYKPKRPQWPVPYKKTAIPFETKNIYVTKRAQKLSKYTVKSMEQVYLAHPIFRS